ncbi:BamA/TamA family outer membrane protein [Parapedobacter tibetensis]|uniref:BamA/TamA family outer membrane protein n=1 Tax=Parapedobacter tibetensis TaxID=2972951 RepID=UPI00214D234A|nr:BamA/TamA family outer membrane protein [Parapedobacter tibetensis]
MDKTLFILVVALLSALVMKANAQDSIRARVIYIGDAGEINHKQEAIIPRAAELIIPGKTTVMFLGDNIYPRGMGLPGSPEEQRTKEILRAQFEPMRAKNAPVYFIPGNHDWDRMGKQGYAKIRAQWQYLEDQQDSLLKMVPPNGCPDPVDIVLSDSLVLIAYDSEWWVFPHERSSDQVECECETEGQVIERLEEMRYKHHDKTILLTSHHPFRSYGVHGGYYSWKHHVFPLTAAKKNLYIPLPAIGSLYPLLRRTVLLNPEDMPHPIYKKMIADVSEVFESFDNIIHFSGHDHGLQLIKDGDFIQVVSGSGAKDSYAKKGRNSLFAYPKQGFVTLDYLNDRSSRITYYTYAHDSITEAFSYTVPYTDPQPLLDSVYGETIGSDSMWVQANEKFEQAGSFRRTFFGENYRKEWAAEAKVPVIRISEIHGGLTPLKRGGGMQSVTLRLEDPSGKQWVIRSVNKRSEALLPEALHHTLAHDFLDDANSAQHPYSALMIPPLANAVNVPATNPVIGIIAPDSALGAYNAVFANTLCLLEEREPLGDSDNTLKMMHNIYNDNDDIYKAKTFLRARILDVLVNDWDRHEDQWRWRDVNKGKKGEDRDYLVVPRDRDQALRLTEGVFPKIASKPFALPMMEGFAPEIKRVNYSMLKSHFLNAHPKTQFNYEEWTEIVNDFVADMTDSILEEGIKRLPESTYETRRAQLLNVLKQRRDNLPKEMDKHYRFINRIVDIKVSNKHEKVIVEDAPGNALRVTIRKINKESEVKGKLMEKIYDPGLTKEIRIYLAAGHDSVMVNTSKSPIKLRIIGGTGDKHYDVQSSSKRVHIYDRGIRSSFTGDTKHIRKHLRTDSANTAFVPVNLYNIWLPLIAAGYNADDGVLLGAGFKYTHQRGFRKTPFTHVQEFVISSSFATGAIKARYNGQWKEAIGKADIVMEARAFVPSTQNYFGLGNASEYDRDTYDAAYYRARFSLYEFQPALQWHPNSTTTLRMGPALQFYQFRQSDNAGRFVNQAGQLHTYDSLTVHQDKSFAGLLLGFIKDNRNSKIIPTRGGHFQTNVKGYTGLNGHAKSFVQATAELSVYGSIAQDAIVVANRIGGGTTYGNTTFYQSLFLGGQGNLRGFRQFRYAGEHLFYNNLELRMKVAQVGNYIMPGQLGMIAFYDVGKVWANGYNSNRIHQGKGGGIYYTPANIAVLQLVAGHSKEGWYPYFSMGFRF